MNSKRSQEKHKAQHFRAILSTLISNSYVSQPFFNPILFSISPPPPLPEEETCRYARYRQDRKIRHKVRFPRFTVPVPVKRPSRHVDQRRLPGSRHCKPSALLSGTGRVLESHPTQDLQPSMKQLIALLPSNRLFNLTTN